MTGAELAAACADVAPRYPAASPALAAVLTGITALAPADRAKLAAAFKAAEPAKQARLAGSAFRSWDDWHPVWRAACQAAAGEHGGQWHLHPETLNARIPAAWANIKLPIGTTKHGPRDIHIPAARFWPGGVLPCGPEYAERGPLEESVVGTRERQARHRAETLARYPELATIGRPRTYAEVQAAVRAHAAPDFDLAPVEWDAEDLAEAAD